MAIGLARIMGFRLMENFDRPYLSVGFGEFWRRWHISLSTWIRDYLYVPLGGNRVSSLRLYLNLWICFLASGLWHGAAWTFVVWGAYQGFFLTLERLGLGRVLARLPRSLYYDTLYERWPGPLRQRPALARPPPRHGAAPMCARGEAPDGWTQGAARAPWLR